ncbi:hypothetical protein ACS0TY_017839 [Phlomoides rotata]
MKEFQAKLLTIQNMGCFFSKNVEDGLREVIKDIFGVHNSINTGRYLGLASLVGRNKREIFNYIKERLSKKLQGWINSKISKVGKEILIKAAAQTPVMRCLETGNPSRNYKSRQELRIFC